MPFFLIFFSFFLLQAEIINNSIKISYQNLKFNNEKLGLLETSLLVEKRYFYYGGSVYSAVNGKRGGFFTGGIIGGIKINLNKIIFDSNVFIGGGGGGSAPQGSGLMIKTDSGFYLPLKNYQVGISYNYIKFKDGLSSSQIAYNLKYLFKDLIFFSPTFHSKNANIENIKLAFFIKNYFPKSKTTLNTTQKQFGVIGVEISKSYPNFNLLLQTAGAFKGESDGYAEYLIGLSKKIKNFETKFLIGSAGGGRVNTKSGLIYQIETSCFLKNIFLSGGYTISDGSFKGYFLKGGIYKNLNLITYGKKYLKFYPQKFTIKIYNESYMPSSSIRKNRNSQRLDTLNIDILTTIKNNLLFLTNAGAAYNGKSGGYAIGMIGLEYNKNNFFINSSLGAAGGGNVAVGNGLISKSQIGFFKKSFFISLGYIKALRGKLNTFTISIGTKFNFYKGIN